MRVISGAGAGSSGADPAQAGTAQTATVWAGAASRVEVHIDELVFHGIDDGWYRDAAVGAFVRELTRLLDESGVPAAALRAGSVAGISGGRSGRPSDGGGRSPGTGTRDGGTFDAPADLAPGDFGARVAHAVYRAIGGSPGGVSR